MMETDIGTSFIIIMAALSVMAASGIKSHTFLKLSGIVSHWNDSDCYRLSTLHWDNDHDMIAGKDAFIVLESL